MSYKFEKLEVWQLAMDYQDSIYGISECLPRAEEFNLKSQITRATNSIALNIAEGSTCQSNLEQARFLSLAIRSLVETVACMHLINRRQYLKEKDCLLNAYQASEKLFAKLNAFRSSLLKMGNTVREEEAFYEMESDSEVDLPLLRKSQA